MFNKTDIFFIILFIIVVTLLVGINISNYIDKKISDISINLPKINIPKPTITLNVSKDDKEKFIVCTENNNCNKSNIDTVDTNKNKIEKFTVPDAQNIYYEKIKKDFMEKYNNTNFIDQEGNGESCPKLPELKQLCTGIEGNMQNCNNCTESQDGPKIVYPKTNKNQENCIDKWQKFYSCNKVIYPGKNTYTAPNGVTYVAEYDYGLDAPPYYVSCCNGAAPNKIKPPFEGRAVAKHVPCNQPNLLTSENYYKTQTGCKHSVPIEDYYIKGYNYGDYLTTSSPYTIDKPILSQATKGLPESSMRVQNLPQGYNYVFQHHVPVKQMA